MDEPKIINATDSFEEALKSKQHFVLKLFVSGMTSKSIKAIENIQKICRDHLRDQVELEIIDIYQQPELARREQVIAVPVLLKKLPQPLRKFIGDLSNTDKILVGLDLVPKPTEEPHENKNE